MSTMDWVKATPQQDGFYWLRRAGEEDTVVKVRDLSAGLVEFGAMVVWVGSDWDMSLCEALQKWKCQWTGPLLPPNVEARSSHGSKAST